MEIKVRIRTPKGEAEKTRKKIQPLIIGDRKIHETYVNKDQSQMIWVVRGSVRDVMKINRNVTVFDSVIKSVFESKPIQKKVNKHLDDKGKEELESMLLKHTSVDVIKKATAEEIIESNMTFWDRIKKNFTKLKS